MLALWFGGFHVSLQSVVRVLSALAPQKAWVFKPSKAFVWLFVNLTSHFPNGTWSSIRAFQSHGFAPSEHVQTVEHSGENIAGLVLGTKSKIALPTVLGVVIVASMLRLRDSILQERRALQALSAFASLKAEASYCSTSKLQRFRKLLKGKRARAGQDKTFFASFC